MSQPSNRVVRPRGSSHQTDRSGFRFFAEGDLGAAHALSHELLDAGDLREGWRRLGAWLDRHGPGAREADPKFAHLQWHMAVFEIGVGDAEAARRRFRGHLLPLVADEAVLTDAPSLLWRLRLAGIVDGLEWEAVAAVARDVLRREQQPDRYVLLHQLMALAGAGDVASIDRWLDGRYERTVTVTEAAVESLLLRLAWALRTFANGDFGPSARLFGCHRTVARLGGSGAQNELFDGLRCCAGEEELALAG